ncbi:MAG: hypothetical protein H7A25_09065 [Leptospiraceae bacterium]|nr:hypothetical protein [Leptospiraceae bacterium]MCP5500040.1 hypothetical protein [Leptospiraceae bacterium]
MILFSCFFLLSCMGEVGDARKEKVLLFQRIFEYTGNLPYTLSFSFRFQDDSSDANIDEFSLYSGGNLYNLKILEGSYIAFEQVELFLSSQALFSKKEPFLHVEEGGGATSQSMRYSFSLPVQYPNFFKSNASDEKAVYHIEKTEKKEFRSPALLQSLRFHFSASFITLNISNASAQKKVNLTISKTDIEITDTCAYNFRALQDYILEYNLKYANLMKDTVTLAILQKIFEDPSLELNISSTLNTTLYYAILQNLYSGFITKGKCN